MQMVCLYTPIQPFLKKRSAKPLKVAKDRLNNKTVQTYQLLIKEQKKAIQR
jgi:hypothetical protein